MERKKIFGLNTNVFFLGLVSFLTDVSSEMIFTLVPLFLSNVLGVATVLIGLVEGISESTASLLKILSGWLSDKSGKRKLITFTGYGLSTLVKPLMYVASSWGIVLGVRFVDRVGKGIRSAPRDALIASSLNSWEWGKGFGLHRAMDTAGAAMGLILAALIVFIVQGGDMLLSLATYQILVIIGVIPAFLALFMFLFVKEAKRNLESSPGFKTNLGINGEKTIKSKERINFSNRFIAFLVIIFIFTLGNSSDAFLILRAQSIGSNVIEILEMLIAFNLVYAFISIPAGMVSDRMSRKYVIVSGWFIYAATYFGLAITSAAWQMWLYFMLYGVYYGFSEGVLRAYVADLVPEASRGTAYGLFYGVVGFTLLPASIIAGWLWQVFSPAATFYFGAVLSVISIIALLIMFRK